LRNSLIAADDGFNARDERVHASGRRGAPAKAKDAQGWRRAFAGQRGLRRLLMIGFAGVVAIGVPVNALLLQDGPHPAPLFHFGAPQAAQKGTSPSVQDAPLPRPRPASLGAAKSEAPRADAAKPDAPKASEKPLDSIGQFLSGGSIEKKGAAAEKDRSVLFAQRALAKLGYSLHQDGVYGGTTRQAIEKFERANGMPVTGELSQKILRRLSTRSGIAFK